ncbi:hypothetical protein Geob_3325 [Geotalea daltonii FRC-32]|uniref:Uncharacterized protein n=1 Tax=Geotalea daltonii (strain DSM 22248 / JCM 15807 / FRC-32) TaxID=316067 RepID=B9M4Y4_GEODF|nr:hypothetical protein [Geotalea daltonii]ACM21668.1 hypothetical protein Geob_3325 [Geotalea daltonii FRC-32]
MASLLVLAVIGGYIILSALAVCFVVRAVTKGRKIKLVAGIVATIVVTLPVTTVLLEYVQTKHRLERYCREEAKVIIFKSLEEWKRENPGVAKNLKPYDDKNAPDIISKGDGLHNSSTTKFLNPRFAHITKKEGPLQLNVFRHSEELVDTKTGQVIAILTDFSSGYGNPFLGARYGWRSYKVWLATDNCPSFDKNVTVFSNYFESIKNIGGIK